MNPDVDENDRDLENALYQRWIEATGHDESRAKRIRRFYTTRHSNFSEASVRIERTFRPLEGDVFVASYPKSGTTLVQQVVHQLRTGGSDDFDEIDVAVPWLRVAKDLGVDVEGDQRSSGAPPRAFKTHLVWDAAPRLPSDAPGARPLGRYLYIVRDPIDAMVSLHAFLRNRSFDDGELSLVDFVEGRLFGPEADWSAHVIGWYRAALAYPDQILWLFYEDLVAERARFVAQIATFIGLGTRADLADRVAVATERSSMSYMQAHQHLFDGHRTPSGPGVRGGERITKVNSRAPGEGRERLPSPIERAARDVLNARLARGLGYETYAELRARAATEINVCR